MCVSDSLFIRYSMNNIHNPSLFICLPMQKYKIAPKMSPIQKRAFLINAPRNPYCLIILLIGFAFVFFCVTFFRNDFRSSNCFGSVCHFSSHRVQKHCQLAHFVSVSTASERKYRIVQPTVKINFRLLILLEATSSHQLLKYGCVELKQLRFAFDNTFF